MINDESRSTFNEPRSVWRLHPSHLLILGLSLIAGFALFASTTARTLFCRCAGIAVLVLLILHPEFALALYVVVGDVKGDDRVAALFPVDLTLLLGAILLAGIALNFARKKQLLPMPPCISCSSRWWR